MHQLCGLYRCEQIIKQVISLLEYLKSSYGHFIQM